MKKQILWVVEIESDSNSVWVESYYTRSAAREYAKAIRCSFKASVRIVKYVREAS